MADIREPPETEEPEPQPVPVAPESGQLRPLLCVGDAPGTASCPVNVVDLAELEVSGSFDFVLQAVGNGVYLSNLKFVAGEDGLRLERPTLRFWTSSTSVSEEITLGAALEIPPFGSASPASAARFARAPFHAVSLRFDAVGSHRP